MGTLWHSAKLRESFEMSFVVVGVLDGGPHPQRKGRFGGFSLALV